MEAKHHSIQRRMVDAINRQLMGEVGGSYILNTLPMEHLHAVRQFILSFALQDDDHTIDWMGPPKAAWEPTGKIDEAPAVTAGEWQYIEPEDFQRGLQAWTKIVDDKLHALETRATVIDNALEEYRRHTGIRAEQLASIEARLARLEEAATPAEEPKRHPATIKIGDYVLLASGTKTLGGANLKEQWAKVLYVKEDDNLCQVELAPGQGTNAHPVPWVNAGYIKDVRPTEVFKMGATYWLSSEWMPDGRDRRPAGPPR